MTVLQRSSARLSASKVYSARTSSSRSSSNTIRKNKSNGSRHFSSIRASTLLPASSPLSRGSGVLASSTPSPFSSTSLSTLRSSTTTTIPTPTTSSPYSFSYTQIRTATYIPRTKKPYTFTQLVRLSDGSMYAHRTTSPVPVYESRKDARNTLLWNPSSEKLMSVESDTAGRLAAFRQRFGRGWDARDGAGEDVAREAEALEQGYEREQAGEVGAGEEEEEYYYEEEEERGGLMDLITDAAGGEKEGGGKKGGDK